MRRDLADTLKPVELLAGDLRRRIYVFVRARGAPVTRDDAAEAIGISRKLAAFHLDKLLEGGLLTAHYARLTGKSGPGAGRSSKLYEPSALEVDVSLPPRRYDFVGQILVDALDRAVAGEPPAEAARAAAHQAGVEIGREARAERRLTSTGRVRALEMAQEVLAGYGFEPYRDATGAVALGNCPFHALAQRSPELVCGLNQAFIEGLLMGIGNRSIAAVLEPRPGRCCVELRPPEAAGA